MACKTSHKRTSSMIHKTVDENWSHERQLTKAFNIVKVVCLFRLKHKREKKYETIKFYCLTFSQNKKTESCLHVSDYQNLIIEFSVRKNHNNGLSCSSSLPASSRTFSLERHIWSQLLFFWNSRNVCLIVYVKVNNFPRGSFIKLLTFRLYESNIFDGHGYHDHCAKKLEI